MKRFTETTRFEDPWYRKLPPEMKLAWEYLYAKCDNAGVIDLDREGAEFHIGATVDWDEFLRQCGPKRITVLESGKWWILRFIEFQYGELSEKSAPHRKVASLLEYHGLNVAYPKGSGTLAVPYLSSSGRAKEEDKEEEEGKEEEKEARRKKSARAVFKPPAISDVADYCLERKNGIDPRNFVDFYQRQGWKLSNGLAMKDWKAAVRTWEKNGMQNGNTPDKPKVSALAMLKAELEEENNEQE